jgi:hypothetical protein
MKNFFCRRDKIRAICASNSPFRQEIILKPEIRKGFQFGNEATSEDGERAKVPNYSWAKMLAQVFKINVTQCTSCGGDLVKVAAITDPMEAKRFLKHVGIPHDAPARAPPRSVQGEFEFEYQPFPDDHHV